MNTPPPYRQTPWEEVIRRLEAENAELRQEIISLRADGVVLRNELDKVKERLLEGNKTFAELRDEQRQRWKTVASVLLAFIATLAGWAYSVTAKPDTVEVRRMIAEDAPNFVFTDKYEADRELMRKELVELRVKQAEIALQLGFVTKEPAQSTKPKRGR